MRRSVDFPQPLGPTIETKLLSCNANDTSSTASVVAKDFVTFCTTTDMDVTP